MNTLQLIPVHESAEYIEADLSLLRRVSPRSKLLQKYATGNNDFNSKERDGYILKELLSVVSIDEILSNRKKSLVIDTLEITDEKTITIVSPTLPSLEHTTIQKKSSAHGKFSHPSNGGKRTTK